ncbi:MAG: lipid II flippase Amj family protein [Kurthia gibsonii]|uniref:Lipid II flippase Amj n=1 Tax=Kurthia gibsonii TaxID=33946 RepID=A0ABU9LLK9_9BACL|nr:lipid II flippase Amj family protein [Kurthia gibsonii]MCA9724672.1 lipid II flippase Amj family protein [Kurthia sp.]MEB7772913.1 lipid II flippase Amj family protein [Kurthia gibsonii]
MEIITTQLIFIAIFILMIHSIETLAYAVRLSGARVGLLASALSLFNILVMVSRMANMAQQPFTGNLLDEAPQDGGAFLETQFRFIIGASTVGTLVGILLLPTFIAVFSRAIIHLTEVNGSVGALFKKGFTEGYFRRSLNYIRLPKRKDWQEIEWKDAPYRLFFINIFITAIYTIGVLSALYAALLMPSHSATATMASGLINGVATILLIIFIDPKISVMADSVIRGKGRYNQLKTASIFMITSRLIGTLVAQLLFIPGAKYIAWFTTLL